jgi:AraC-like DNA-binding protein
MSERTVETVAHLPAPLLRPFVERYLAYRLEGFPPGIHRGLPSRHLTFIISLADPIEVVGSPGAMSWAGSFTGVVSGLHPGPALIRHRGTQVGIALEVTPLGARGLFGGPAAVLASTIVEPKDILGRGSAALPERLWHAASRAEQFQILDEVLSRSLKDRADVPVELAFSWRSLVATAGGLPVRRIAHEVGWSRRHFAARFRTEFGIPPKLAARILRFDRARWSLAAMERPSLVAAAHSAGYFDQAHFTRDFNQFAGCPPSRWIAEEFPFVQDEAPVVRQTE